MTVSRLSRDRKSRRRRSATDVGANTADLRDLHPHRTVVDRSERQKPPSLGAIRRFPPQAP
jgi:hypothetical protein